MRSYDIMRKILESPWGSPIPIGDGDGDVNRFPDGDGDGDGDEAKKRGWGCIKSVTIYFPNTKKARSTCQKLLKRLEEAVV
ncbi:hypothetical protein Tco_1523770 [Tanacetum coccineum]